MKQVHTGLMCRERGAGTGVLGRGLKGLVGGVTAGVTGVVRTPIQSYNDGTGVMTGLSSSFAHSVPRASPALHSKLNTQTVTH